MANIEALLTRIEANCRDCRERDEKNFDDLRSRMEKLASNELFHIEARLKVLEARKNGIMTPGDWVKVLIAIITGSTAIFVAYINIMKGG